MNPFELEAFLNEILEPWKFSDYCHNGIQVEGTHEIKKVALGVSFNNAFMDRAIESQAQLLLVHHGIFGKNFFSLKGFNKRRVEKLLNNNLNLIGYHLPLDANNPYGNNASIAKKLGLEIIAPLAEIGFLTEFEEPVPFSNFMNNLQKLIPNQKLLVYNNCPLVKRVGIISGGAADYLTKLEGNFDTYVTGEVKEHTKEAAKEMGVNFIAAGHYATETFGVKNLGKLLEEKFNLDVEFIDVPNKV